MYLCCSSCTCSKKNLKLNFGPIESFYFNLFVFLLIKMSQFIFFLFENSRFQFIYFLLNKLMTTNWNKIKGCESMIVSLKLFEGAVFFYWVIVLCRFILSSSINEYESLNIDGDEAKTITLPVIFIEHQLLFFLSLINMNENLLDFSDKFALKMS